MPSVIFMGTGGPRRDPRPRASSLRCRSGAGEVLDFSGRLNLSTDGFTGAL